MRQFDSCPSQRQQQQQQQQPSHHGARAPGRGMPARPAAAAAADETLEQAAALWPTRRIRSYFLLLDPSAGQAPR